VPTDADTFATAMPAAWATTGAVVLKPLNPAAVHSACAADPDNSRTKNAPAPRTEPFVLVVWANVLRRMPACSTLTGEIPITRKSQAISCNANKFVPKV
jgi:hypothetical protein